MGVTEMPIGRYVKKGTVFSPETLTAMSEALDATAETLGIGAESKQRVIAKFIIRLAQENPRLTSRALYDQAVAALGGEGYKEPRSRSVPALAK
jgi:hypothetical protein